MPPLLRFVLTRLFSIIITLFIITAILYGIVMLTPVEERAMLYYPKGGRASRTPEQEAQLMKMIIQRNHLNDPYPIQYTSWITNLVKGNWGFSMSLQGDVWDVLVRRTPVTAELTLYSLILFIPSGIISGVAAAKNRHRSPDTRFRLAAFIATSMPPFILALVLLAIFYVMLHWFPPERLSIENSQVVRSAAFKVYTGMMTIDGILNRRADISLDAFRHLVLPVITLSLIHWATLGRVMRATMIEELDKDYVTAGKGRGISTNKLVWRHALRNALTPALSTTALSAATLLSGVFVVEIIYNFRGLSSVAISSVAAAPDAPALLGFGVYSVFIVVFLMFFLDLIMALADPRVREGVLN